MRFPVRSIKESWIPVRAGETERFEGLIANLTPVVTFTSRASSSREPAAFTVRPQGRLGLHVWADNEAPLALSTSPGAVATPNTVHRLTTTDDTARIEVQWSAGGVTAQHRY